MSVDADKAAALQKTAIETLWRRGNLHWKLHSTQILIRKAIRESKQRIYYLSCSRRLGKSTLMLILAVEKCLQKPNARVIFLMPYAKDAATLAQDTLAEVMADCPEDLRPTWHGQTKEISFNNGALIRLRGVNGESAAFLRGGSADMVLLDECATMDNLEEILSSVVLPMTMTTNGTVILATTPADSPGHDSAALFEKLSARGATSVFTLKDAPHITDSVKMEYLTEAGETPEHAEACIKGDAVPKTTTAQREYYCLQVTDASSAVIPEFTRELEAEIVKEWTRPPYYYSLVSLDPGFQDMSAALFAYVDFAQGKLIVEDEFLLEKANTEDIAKAIKAKEHMLWPNKETSQ